jgi:hypothetical protein
MSESIYPTTCSNNPEDMLPQYENTFTTKKWSGGQHGELPS